MKTEQWRIEVVCDTQDKLTFFQRDFPTAKEARDLFEDMDPAGQFPLIRLLHSHTGHLRHFQVIDRKGELVTSTGLTTSARIRPQS
jgi:hypothetical protein